MAPKVPNLDATVTHLDTRVTSLDTLVTHLDTPVTNKDAPDGGTPQPFNFGDIFPQPLQSAMRARFVRGQLKAPKAPTLTPR